MNIFADSPAQPVARAVESAYGRRSRVDLPDAVAARSADVTERGIRGVECVLVVGDCRLFSDCLAVSLSVAGIPAIETASDLPSMLIALAASDVDLLVIDMATRDSSVLLRAALSIDRGMKVIALGTSGHRESEMIGCVAAGVVHYHMRSDPLSDLMVLLRNVSDEWSASPPRVSPVSLRRRAVRAAAVPDGRDIALTVRETQVLRMLELGRSNRDIAARLDIAVHTVKNHVHSLLTKLGVNSRTEAAALSRALRI
ncbi:helix-turn-helix transcriptional regulator [Mycolicibacterium litorale]|uniref:helix-turn-helix transcriptional regulator n=1 Tax=Mycolicibacterium litorale TaxID=758802 RepID=UPI003CFBA7F5